MASSFVKFLDHTQQSVGLLCTSDQPYAETSDNTQHSQDTDILAPGGIPTHNSSKRATADPRLDRGATNTAFYTKRSVIVMT